MKSPAFPSSAQVSCFLALFRITLFTRAWLGCLVFPRFFTVSCLSRAWLGGFVFPRPDLFACFPAFGFDWAVFPLNNGFLFLCFVYFFALDSGCALFPRLAHVSCFPRLTSTTRNNFWRFFPSLVCRTGSFST